MPAAGVGIGFKPRHFDALMADAARPAFVEVHAENYMGDGGLPHAQLAAIAAAVPVSVHGVGLSIGGIERPDRAHLDRLARLLARYRPALFSEHLAWCMHAGRYFNTLLPLRYDDAALQRVCAHVDEVQQYLGRRLLLENPSRYFEFGDATLAEPAFLAEVVRRTGCGLLLDLNNVVVSCHNTGGAPLDYVDALPLAAVGEIHLAGHAREVLDDGSTLLVDDHGSAVADPVWALFATVARRIGARPTLIEWDTGVPDYAVLRAQAATAERILADLAPAHAAA
jgi:uncharacterized protein (UPF0276 family)